MHNPSSSHERREFAATKVRVEGGPDFLTRVVTTLTSHSVTREDESNIGLIFVLAQRSLQILSVFDITNLQQPDRRRQQSIREVTSARDPGPHGKKKCSVTPLPLPWSRVTALG